MQTVDAFQPTAPLDAARLVLIIDDNPMLLRCLDRALGECPLPIATCTSPGDALHLVEQGKVQVIISDISMPEMSGLSLMRRVHAIDADLPVILLTGVPCVDSAAEAVGLGAFSYLLKPVETEVLLVTIERASQAYGNACRQREVLSMFGCKSSNSLMGELEQTFEAALGSLWLAYQPIVQVSNRTVAGYEALMRSENPVLAEPDSVLRAAELLKSMDRVGRGVRDRAACVLQNAAETVTLFVNLHPQDLLDQELLRADSPLADVANRVVLEITERAGLSNIDNLGQKIRELRRLGYRIAVDDLGSGYSGLNNVTELEPEFIKLDMTLVRHIDQSPVKQKVVSSLIALGNAIGASIIAEGIETRAECRTIVELGCKLLQGYLFARPEREFPLVDWPSSSKHSLPLPPLADTAVRHTQSGVHVVAPCEETPLKAMRGA
jgi:EAL domain-containing protein (putative c-di-GMP-specific phosphodiesterase class I)/ActR/RegA family two-component response regulator